MDVIGQRSGCDRIVIMGGSGFIGTRLAELLCRNGRSVRIADVCKSSAFPELWVPCDIRDAAAVGDAIRGCSAIINLAAEHRDNVRPLSRYYETNVEGARQLCLAARERGIQKIVFTSSVAVYGFQNNAVDEAGPFVPFNAYGETKLQAEAVYREWASEDKSRSLIVVRPTVVFGEGNRGNVYNLMQQIASGRFLMVGSGENVKSMAYVGNVAAFLVHVLTMGPGERIFNYVDGPDMNTRDLVRHLRASLGLSPSIPKIPKPVALAGGFMLDLVARLSGRTFPISAVRVRKFCESTQFRAVRAMESGFVPPFSLGEGLERTIRFDFAPKNTQ